MKEIMKELKEELEGKVMTLLDLDWKVERIMNTEETLFENIDIALENKSYAYIYNFDNSEYIHVKFNVIEGNEDKEEILVKVTKIEVI